MKKSLYKTSYKLFNYSPISLFPIDIHCNQFYNSYLENEKTKEIYQEMYQSKLISMTPPSTISGYFAKNILISRYQSQIDQVKNIIDSRIAVSDIPSMNDCSKYYFSRSSKLLRPLLIFMFNQLVEEEVGSKVDSNKIVKLAACIESLHTSSLLHDDVIDESTQRRSSKSAYSAFGIKESVNGGINLIVNSTRVLQDLNNSKVMELYSITMHDLIKGEFKQNFRKDRFIDIPQLISDNLIKSYYKTASIMANSLRSVAIIQNLDEHFEEKLFLTGLHAGISFQLADDLLDLSGNSEVMGKPSFIDIKDNLVNIHLLFELHASKNERLLELIENENKSEAQIEEIVSILNNGTGKEKMQNLMLDHLFAAIQNLKLISEQESSVRNLVQDSLMFLVKRIK